MEVLRQAEAAGLIRPHRNELGIRIGWVLTRRGRRLEARPAPRVAMLATYAGLAALPALLLLAWRMRL